MVEAPLKQHTGFCVLAAVIYSTTVLPGKSVVAQKKRKLRQLLQAYLTREGTGAAYDFCRTSEI
jgi:hypothetical protein